MVASTTVTDGCRAAKEGGCWASSEMPSSMAARHAVTVRICGTGS